ncbi:type II/IV secretion system protein [Patescibacteria group bacterium]|nr:MAG: type II/IV secretion system protein [Patescibacteria group bacterium]
MDYNGSMVKVIKSKIKTDSDKSVATQKILTKFNKAEEEVAASKLAREHDLFYVDLNLFPMSSDDIRTISEEDSHKYSVAVFQRRGKNIKVGVVNPDAPGTQEFVEHLKKDEGYQTTLYVFSVSSLEKVWNKFKFAPLLENVDMLRMSLSGADLEEFDRNFGNLVELKKRIREIPTTQVVNIIMAGAVKMGASDIHFEPQEGEVRLRYRIDGVLQDIGMLPSESYTFILNRVKMMGKMKLNIRKISQDGHFAVELENNKIDIRVNVIPGNHGESVVMRLLNEADVLLDMEKLGIRGKAYEELLRQMDKPNGMILNTGPTGSGKTTTLYAIINKLNTADVKIITIEDPIEYQIKGISQTEVSKSKDYTFAKGLRAIVRQDPDVVLVGEIRDDETADIAVNAALTGHLVLSTIHTNSAAATVPRLIELGVKPNLLPPSVNAFIAQRLVRKLCTFCREEYVPAPETVESIKRMLALISPKAKLELPKEVTKLYRPKGCPKCNGIGYKGRIGVFEIITMTDAIVKLVENMASEGDIAREALEEGMITMTQDGILKAVDGTTSIDEVVRVTGQTDFLENVYEKLMDQTLARYILVQKKDFDEVAGHTGSFADLSKFIRETNQKDTLRYVIAAALHLKAGDIHVEPEEAAVKIRLRIDGVLQEVAAIPLNEYPTFLGGIKMLSGLRTESREGVKDSRFSIQIENTVEEIMEKKVDVRVSIILGGYGETVVMRLLNQAAVALDIEKLGIRKQNLDKILHEIKKPNGIFLNTGPTGSGKTTTLYSLLRTINHPDVKIITVEDPIEYQLPGILQTQANEEGGYTFATALRALLRQNPDIMMVGEIRDDETANVAVQSALTGHLVLSTLHTNDASGAVPRLINMGVRSDDLATAFNAFMAQRLVRKLCSCREARDTKPEEAEKIKRILATVSPLAGVEIPSAEHVYQPKGCEKCNGTGFKGRTTISEVLVADREIREMIAHSELSMQIKEKAIEKGMLTMLQDGIIKVLEGETTLEEVERVAEE